jgi:hypothetical protein
MDRYDMIELRFYRAFMDLPQNILLRYSGIQVFQERRVMRDSYEYTVYLKHASLGRLRFDFEVFEADAEIGEDPIDQFVKEVTEVAFFDSQEQLRRWQNGD